MKQLIRSEFNSSIKVDSNVLQRDAKTLITTWNTNNLYFKNEIDSKQIVCQCMHHNHDIVIIFTLTCSMQIVALNQKHRNQCNYM